MPIYLQLVLVTQVTASSNVESTNMSKGSIYIHFFFFLSFINPFYLFSVSATYDSCIS